MRSTDVPNSEHRLYSGDYIDREERGERRMDRMEWDIDRKRHEREIELQRILSSNRRLLRLHGIYQSDYLIEIIKFFFKKERK